MLTIPVFGADILVVYRFTPIPCRASNVSEYRAAPSPTAILGLPASQSQVGNTVPQNRMIEAKDLRFGAEHKQMILGGSSIQCILYRKVDSVCPPVREGKRDLCGSGRTETRSGRYSDMAEVSWLSLS